MDKLNYLCDNKRHLICVPYSIKNLHRMANRLNISACWFHKDHYDIPLKRIEEINKKCIVVSQRRIFLIARFGWSPQDCLPENVLNLLNKA
jgi:hypothetical protein